MRVERREGVEVAVKLFGFLASLAVGVFFAADNDGIYGDEDRQEPGKYRLDGDEDDACDGLSRLCDAEFCDMLVECLDPGLGGKVYLQRRRECIRRKVHARLE